MNVLCELMNYNINVKNCYSSIKHFRERLKADI